MNTIGRIYSGISNRELKANPYVSAIILLSVEGISNRELKDISTRCDIL